MRCALRSLVSAIFAVVAIGPLAAADRSVTKVAAWEPARAEPVESDIASEKQLRTGIRSYVTGDFKSAADQLSAALQGTLTNDQTARALLYRGLTFRKQGSPGRALTDLTRALQQANGLSDAERSAAEENRNLASQEAGLGMAEAVAAPVVPLATAEPAPKPVAPVIASKAAAAPAEGKWIETAIDHDQRRATRTKTRTGSTRGRRQGRPGTCRRQVGRDRIDHDRRRAALT